MNATSKDYYDLIPSREHQPGDIWCDVPTHGLLCRAFAPAIIITPACDLSNHKVETLSYLPILSVQEFLTCYSAARGIKRETVRQAATTELRSILIWSDDVSLPQRGEIESALALCQEHVNTRKKLKAEALTALRKCVHGLEFLLGLYNGVETRVQLEHFRELFSEGERKKITREIVTNGRNDTHFLPYDDQPAAYSAVPQHSVVLFRFPLTAPVEIFELAQIPGEIDWPLAMKNMSELYPISNSFTNRPMKRATLKGPYVSDLITRYTSIYTRLGSPDFSRHLIDAFVDEID